MSRPEHTAPPEIFYGVDEASKYHANSRIATIQDAMTRRCVELLELPDDGASLLMDIGCGSGLSGAVLSEMGHAWVGLDISESMLNIASKHADDAADDGAVSGDLFLQDIGQGLGFRPGVFDGAISVSVIQWLCNADKANNNPRKRLLKFFNSLYSALRRGAKAALQFYPESDKQTDMIKTAALRAGFNGGIVIDYPESKKAKKYFLCLTVGRASDPTAVKQTQVSEHSMNDDEMEMDLDSDDEASGTNIVQSAEELLNSSVKYVASKMKDKRGKTRGKKSIKPAAGSKEYVLYKKNLNKLRGKEVPRDSKYTARKRRVKF